MGTFELPELDGLPSFVAWFEPEQYIVDYVAPFFMRRFTGMRFSILTPYRSAHWNLTTLSYGAGLTRDDAPTGDAVESWRDEGYRAFVQDLSLLTLDAHIVPA